jgi:hypothetical protein
MLELIFTVCSVVQGAACKELAPITLEENSLPIACVIASQIEGARWVESHPNFYIQRATCQPAGRHAKA